MDNDNEWKVISGRKGKGGFRPPAKKEKPSPDQERSSIKDAFKGEELKLFLTKKLGSSKMFEQVTNMMDIELKRKGSEKISRIVIKGLGYGSVSENKKAFSQIVFASILADYLEAKYKKEIINFAFDPVFGIEDKKMIGSLFNSIITEKNDSELYAIDDLNDFHVYLMFHCERETYEDMILKTINHHKSLVLIGNSIMSYIEKAQLSGKTLSKEFESEARKLVIIPLADFDEIYSAFNDTCFQHY